MKLATCDDEVPLLGYENGIFISEKFTEGTLAMVRDVRRQWLILPEPNKNFTKVAKESFKIIGDNLELEKVNEACGYHLQYYRNFTDISKLERAKTTKANSGIKGPAEDNSQEIDEAGHQHQAKVSRPKRHLLKEGTTPGKTSSNILPHVCLICKRPGPLYVTDAVNKFRTLYITSFKLLRVCEKSRGSAIGKKLIFSPYLCDDI